MLLFFDRERDLEDLILFCYQPYFWAFSGTCANLGLAAITFGSCEFLGIFGEGDKTGPAYRVASNKHGKAWKTSQKYGMYGYFGGFAARFQQFGQISCFTRSFHNTVAPVQIAMHRNQGQTGLAQKRADSRSLCRPDFHHHASAGR